VTQAHQRPRHLLPPFHVRQQVRAARERHRIGPLAVQNPRASSSVRGARIEKRQPHHGASTSLSPGEIFAGGEHRSPRAISTFPRRRNAQSLGPIDMREMARSITWVTSRFLFGKRLHDFFGSDGNFIILTPTAS